MAETLTLPREHAEAAHRVLFVASKMLTEVARHANHLHAVDGSLWTVRELRDHCKAAAKMLAKDLK